MVRRVAIIALAALCMGCQSDDRSKTADSDTAAAAATDITVRPPTRQDTIMIEGTAEASTSTLLTTPADFPLPFSTYVPDGIAAQVDSAGVRFSAAFGGVENQLAYMYVHPHPPGTELHQARDRVGEFLISRVANDDPLDTDDYADTWDRSDAPDWAVEAYTFEDDQVAAAGTLYSGRVILARHGTTFFHVIIHYPAEYGDGLGPRFDAILEHWRWEDTGTRLISSP